jgi:hypothetical protein
VLLDDEPLLAIITLDDARRAITKLRVYVVVPQIERLEVSTPERRCIGGPK